ncbi:hypothetical protein WA158_008049 [Blastocystis sp. Blastoise]
MCSQIISKLIPESEYQLKEDIQNTQQSIPNESSSEIKEEIHFDIPSFVPSSTSLEFKKSNFPKVPKGSGIVELVKSLTYDGLKAACIYLLEQNPSEYKYIYDNFAPKIETTSQGIKIVVYIDNPVQSFSPSPSIQSASAQKNNSNFYKQKNNANNNAINNNNNTANNTVNNNSISSSKSIPTYTNKYTNKDSTSTSIPMIPYSAYKSKKQVEHTYIPTSISSSSSTISSTKEYSPYNGYIFGAKNYTFKECLDRMLFGLPNHHIKTIQQYVIHNQTRIFLFNFSSRELYGVFIADSEPGLFLEPDAWTKPWDNNQSSYVRNHIIPEKSPFGAQVRVRFIKKYEKPIQEEDIKHILEYPNPAKNIFLNQLTNQQTKKIIAIFEKNNS